MNGLLMALGFDYPLIRAFCLILVLGVVTWLVSVYKKDGSIVDSVWSILILLAACVYWQSLVNPALRAWVMLGLSVLWALRLSIYITAKHWGKTEDRRYQRIRARNQPYFAFKSLYLVYVLQVLLAWLVALPLYAGFLSAQPWGLGDTVGSLLMLIGLVIESVADQQMATYKAQKTTQLGVLNTGLWRYSRHPNYLGEFCIWWGFYLMAACNGGAWTILSPLLMSVLLIKVSGVELLEKDIAYRLPGYQAYIESTPSFFPRLVPRKPSAD